MYKVRLVEKIYKIKTETQEVDGEKEEVEVSRMEWDKKIHHVFVLAKSKQDARNRVKAKFRIDKSKAGYEIAYKVGRAIYKTEAREATMEPIEVIASEIVRDENWRETIKTIGV